MGLLNKLLGDKSPKETKQQRFVCEPKTIYCPLKGKVIPLESVSDPAFSQGIMGPGVGIEPENGQLYAPVDGSIVALFPTGHAVGIKSADGAELLIHIGIDTVEMNGNGFKTFVKQGDSVLAGTLMVEFDCGKIQEAGYQTTTMVIVSNASEIGELVPLSFGNKEAMEALMKF